MNTKSLRQGSHPRRRQGVMSPAGGALLAGMLFTLPQPAALAQRTEASKSQPSAQTTIAALNRMAAAGKSQQELAQYVFETHGCIGCHTAGRNGKLGFTEKGKRVGQGFEGCISLLTAMHQIAKVPAAERSPEQRRKAARFEEFGCTFCHSISPGKAGLTEVGSRLAHLHLGCVDVEKLVAGDPTPKR